MTIRPFSHQASSILVGINRRVSGFLGSLAAKLHGIDLGDGCKIIGAPTVSGTHLGSIVLADRVVLVSNGLHTALGVSHPVILRLLRPGAEITIGNDTGVSGASICAASRVSIGDRVLVGADALIFDTDFHPSGTPIRRYLPETFASTRPVEIDDDAFIGARAIICKGVRIGRSAVVAAGSVVTKDVNPYTVVAGNPARPIGNVGE